MSPSATVKMYSRPGCGYCSAARQLLRQKGISFEDINIGGNADLRREMEALSGGYTVPQIFINDQPIGGYDDMAELEHNGKLDELLGGHPD